MGLREEILAASDLGLEAIEIPEWPGEFCVRVMTGAERNAWQARVMEGDTSARMQNVFAELAVRCLCDAAGQRIFEDGDAAALGKKSGMVLDRIWDAASKLNGLSRAEVEEIQKN